MQQTSAIDGFIKGQRIKRRKKDVNENESGKSVKYIPRDLCMPHLYTAATVLYIIMLSKLHYIQLILKIDSGHQEGKQNRPVHTVHAHTAKTNY